MGYFNPSHFCQFSFFSSVGIIHFATISVVQVVMDFFINQGAYAFLLIFALFLLKSGTRGVFVLARVCSYSALELIYLQRG